MPKTHTNHPDAATAADEKPKRAPKVGALVAIGRRSAAPETVKPDQAIEGSDTQPQSPEVVDTADQAEPILAAAAQHAEPPLASPVKPPTKIETLVALLRQPEGARIEAMMAATGWQAHSVRGAMSGAIKKGLGLTVLSEKVDGQRIYRIPVEAEA